MGNTMDNIITKITEGDFSYIIRYSRPEDFEQVFDIWYENQKYSLNRNELKPIEQLKEKLNYQFLNQDHNFKFWLAECNNQILGYNSTNPTESNPMLNDEIAEVSTYIHKDFWDKNIGYNLMKTCLDGLPWLELKTLYGRILPTNIFAIKLVESLNWKLIGKIPFSLKEPKVPELFFYIYNVPKI